MSTSPTQNPSTLARRYGPWALITGASDGIGRASAVALAEAGLNVMLVARREAALVALAETIEATHGVHARVIAADLSLPDEVARVCEAAEALELGVVIAAAGFGTSGPLLEGALEEELAMIDVNCRAVVAMSHRLGAHLARRGGGALVLFSSIVAFQGVPRAATYAATKAFVQSFAEGLRVELAPSGVEVLASAPGPVHSGFAARAGMVMGKALTPEIVARQTLAALGRRAGTVRPGWLSIALEAALKTLPRWGRVRVMTLIMRGMTPDHAPAHHAKAQAELLAP